MRGSGERGTITAFVAIASFGLLVAGGLAVDGGVILAARQEAGDVAKAAARAGAQAVDESAVRSRRSTALDARRAARAVRRHLRSTGHSGRTRVRRGRVVVTVRMRTRLHVLGLVGMRTVTVTETADARLVRGVRRGET